jgi:hypothetical protein
MWYAKMILMKMNGTFEEKEQEKEESHAHMSWNWATVDVHFWSLTIRAYRSLFGLRCNEQIRSYYPEISDKGIKIKCHRSMMALFQDTRTRGYQNRGVTTLCTYRLTCLLGLLPVIKHFLWRSHFYLVLRVDTRRTVLSMQLTSDSDTNRREIRERWSQPISGLNFGGAYLLTPRSKIHWKLFIWVFQPQESMAVLWKPSNR